MDCIERPWKFLNPTNFNYATMRNKAGSPLVWVSHHVLLYSPKFVRTSPSLDDDPASSQRCCFTSRLREADCFTHTNRSTRRVLTPDSTQRATPPTHCAHSPLTPGNSLSKALHCNQHRFSTSRTRVPGLTIYHGPA